MLKMVTNFFCALIIVALILSYVNLKLVPGWQALGGFMLVATVSSTIVIALSVANILNRKLKRSSDTFPLALGGLLVMAVTYLLLVFVMASPSIIGDAR